MKCKRSKPEFFVGALLMLLFLTGNTHSFMIPQTVERLAVSSTEIIRATVQAKESYWNETHSTIYTYVTLRVLEPYKGALTVDSTISVRIWGGEVGDTAIIVEHAPFFGVGEEVVVFLRKTESVFSVAAWEQGKFTLVNGQVKEKRLPITEFTESIRRALGK